MLFKWDMGLINYNQMSCQFSKWFICDAHVKIRDYCNIIIIYYNYNKYASLYVCV